MKAIIIVTFATLALIVILVFLLFSGGRIGPNPGVGPPVDPRVPASCAPPECLVVTPSPH